MPTISALPAAPDPNDRSTFNARAYHWSAALSAMTGEINNVLPTIDAAATASAAAIAAAHYMGPWASLSGALPIPASASHNGVVWVLTEPVANVGLEIPGVSAKWIAVSGAQVMELIGTTNAASAATVEWSNFDTLAATYAALRVVGEGIVGSAATADLRCTLRQNATWIGVATGIHTAGFSGDAAANVPGGNLSSAGALKNVSHQALSLDMDISALSPIARPNVRFSLMEATNSGASSNAVSVFGYLVTAKSWTPTTSLQGLRIFASTGTISGVFRLYGVRK